MKNLKNVGDVKKVGDGNDNVKVMEASKTNFPSSTFFSLSWRDLRMSVSVIQEKGKKKIYKKNLRQVRIT